SLATPNRCRQAGLKRQLPDEVSLRVRQSVSIRGHGLHPRLSYGVKGGCELLAGRGFKPRDPQSDAPRRPPSQITIETRDLGKRIDQLRDPRQTRDGFLEKLQSFSDELG